MPVCIAGMHRSGTSMVAHMLNLCGLYLGEEQDLQPPGPANPEGFWENSRFSEINEQILQAIGLAWDLPFTAAPGWEATAAIQPLRATARALIEEFKYSEPWGWKDPRNSLTLPFWKSLLPGLRLVICLRSPAEVAQSLHRRGASSLRFGYSLWHDYYRQILGTTVPEERLITHYDSYFADAQQELRRLLDFVGLNLPELALQRARSIVMEPLRHHDSRADSSLALDIPSEVAQLYRELCAQAGPVYQATLGIPRGAAGSSARPSQPTIPSPTAAGRAARIAPPLAETALVSVIVPNYNGREHLDDCLSSLLETHYPSDQLEIIVIDNGSSDGSAAWVEEHFPGVHIIRNPSNAGFSRAANLGARAASGGYLAFLNNDLRVDPDWLSALLEVMASEPRLASVGSIVMSWDGARIDFAGRAGDAFCLAVTPDAGHALPPSPLPSGAGHYALFASGGAALFRRQAFEELGGFEPGYFMYHEDVDLGWRLWLAGCRCALASGSLVYHKGGASAGRLPPAYIQTLAQKHALCTAFTHLSTQNLRDLLPVLLYALLERGRQVPAARQSLPAALKEFRTALPGLTAKRAAIQQKRLSSDEEIFALAGHPLGFLVHRPSYGATCKALAEYGLEVDLDPTEAGSAWGAIAEWLNAAHLLHERQMASELEALSARVAAPAPHAWWQRLTWRSRLPAPLDGSRRERALWLVARGLVSWQREGPLVFAGKAGRLIATGLGPRRPQAGEGQG